MPIQWTPFTLIKSLFAAADQTQNFLYESPGGPPAGPFPQRTSGCGGAGKWYWLLAVAVASVCSGLTCMPMPMFEHKLALDTNSLDTGLTRCLYWTSSKAWQEGEGRYPSNLWETPVPVVCTCLRSTIHSTVTCWDSMLVSFGRQISLVFFLENPIVMCSRIFITGFLYYGIGMELNMGRRTCSAFDFVAGELLVLGSVVWTEILAVHLV